MSVYQTANMLTQYLYYYSCEEKKTMQKLIEKIMQRSGDKENIEIIAYHGGDGLKI